MVLIFSNNLSAQTAEFDTTSGYLTIPLLKLGADVYEQVRFQYDGNLDFNVVDFAKKTESDAKTNATFNGSTLDLKVVKVGEVVYSNLEFAFQPPLKFSITKVQEPKKIGETSLENRQSREWININELMSSLRTEYKDIYNSDVYNNIVYVYADLDLDGDDDLFVVPSMYPSTGGYTQENYGSVPGQLWLNNGASSFTRNVATIEFDMPLFEHGRKSITADFNGDKFPDIVVADHGFDADPFPGGRLHIVLSEIDGSYTKKTIGGIGFHHGVSAGDFDNDGDIDLFSVAEKNGGLLLNDGRGNFTSNDGITGFRNRPDQIFNSVSGDLDEDGMADIVLIGESWTTVPTILYQKRNGFEEVQLPYRQPYQNILDAAFVDVNEDGILDVLLLATGGDEQRMNRYKGIGVYAVLMTENRKAGQIVDLYSDESYTDQWFPFIRAQDINSDGITDIFSEDRFYNFLLIGEGGGKFNKQYAFVSPEFNNWDIKFDLNNDGHQDIITRQTYAHPDTITYGSAEEFIDKDERYLELSPIPGFEFTFKLTPGDLNADGYADLVATATNTSTGQQVGCAIGVHFLFGKELNEYRTVYSDDESGICYEAKLVDTDADGDLDITTQINGGAKLTLINDGEGRFTLLE